MLMSFFDNDLLALFMKSKILLFIFIVLAFSQCQIDNGEKSSDFESDSVDFMKVVDVALDEARKIGINGDKEKLDLEILYLQHQRLVDRIATSDHYLSPSIAELPVEKAIIDSLLFHYACDAQNSTELL